MHQSFVLNVGKVPESSWDILLDMHLDALDLSFVDVCLLQVVRAGKFY